MKTGKNEKNKYRNNAFLSYRGSIHIFSAALFVMLILIIAFQNTTKQLLLYVKSASSKDVYDQAGKYIALAMVFLILLLLIFVAYTIHICLIGKRRHNELVSRNNESEAIIRTAGGLFKRFAVLNIQKETYKYYLRKNEKAPIFPTEGNLHVLKDIFINYFVESESEKKLSEFMRPENIAEAFSHGEDVYHFEYQLVNSEKWERINILPLEYNSKGLKSVLFAVEDITELKLEEEQRATALSEAFKNAEAANNAKSVFLTSMSHDIRTPMNAIMGMTTIAKTHLDDKEKVSDCLEKICVSSNHLLGLINNVLDMSKIESGQIELSEEIFNIHDLMDSVQILTRPQAEAKSLTLNFNAADISHDLVCGDLGRIQQVFVNLVGNSIKYTPERGTVSLAISEKPSQSDSVCLYDFVIADNGIGMTAEFVKKIFDPFSRAQDSRIKNIQGAGLGMAITKNIISMMNGDINVESRLNEGTTITVSLFLKPVAEAKKTESVSELPLIDSFPGKRVMLVEDNALNAEIATELIKMHDISVDHITNGKLAVDKMMEVDDGYYDMILMDIQMPVMDGYDATVAIRSLPGKYPAEVPIIALSANAFDEDVRKAKNAGMNDHLSKPLDIHNMLVLFNKYL